MCFISVGFALSILSAPVFATEPWKVQGEEARLGSWVVSARDIQLESGLEASEFVLMGQGGVLIRGERLKCTDAECEMVKPVVYRGGSAIRAERAELVLATGRVVLRELGNRTFEER